MFDAGYRRALVDPNKAGARSWQLSHRKRSGDLSAAVLPELGRLNAAVRVFATGPANKRQRSPSAGRGECCPAAWSSQRPLRLKWQPHP